MSQESYDYDAIVVGSGPNGLTAAACLSERGLKVLVVEGDREFGGGVRSGELTLPGYVHDHCSAVHTLGFVSPVFRELQLERHGLEWCYPSASVAHPLDGGRVALLEESIDLTSERLGSDAARYRKLVTPFLRHMPALYSDLLAPLGLPKHPLLMARFAWWGLRSAQRLAQRWSGDEARALLAGCAAHSTLPLDRWVTAAVGLMFLVTGHVGNWLVVRGGSRGIALALRSVIERNGGELQCDTWVKSLEQLPSARAVLFDLAPAQIAGIAHKQLPGSYLASLRRYRMGPASFKLDFALNAPIPWRSPECARASTVHLGGSLEEIAESEASVWRGEHSKHPFVLLTQQSHFDSSRAPAGRHTGYAYCHVPAGSTVDMSTAIINQIDRFAPGFQDTVLECRATFPRDFEANNPSFVGGAITGGVADWRQLFARPVARLDPYSTPNRRLFICSQSTPPGGGVHGMCGFHAARSVLRRIFGVN